MTVHLEGEFKIELSHSSILFEKLPVLLFYQSIASQIPLSLISEKDNSKFLQYAALIPASFRVESLGFECGLKRGEQWGDFHFATFCHSLNLLDIQSSATRCGLFQSVGWLKTFEFLNQWVEKDLFVQKKIKAICFEFDIGSVSSWPPQPNLFLTLHPNSKDVCEIVDRIFECLMQKKISTQMLNLVNRCSSENFQICNIGYMLARPHDALRVAVRGDPFERSAILSYLTRLGHSGFEKDLDDLFEKIKPHISHFSLEVDIADQVFPKIGISLNMKEDCGLLKILISEGLMDPEKYKALLSWVGPRFDLSITDLLFVDSSSQRFIFKSIHHVKIVFAPNKPLQTKIYLQVRAYRAVMRNLPF